MINYAWFFLIIITTSTFNCYAVKKNDQKKAIKHTNLPTIPKKKINKIKSRTFESLEKELAATHEEQILTRQTVQNILDAFNRQSKKINDLESELALIRKRVYGAEQEINYLLDAQYRPEAQSQRNNNNYNHQKTPVRKRSQSPKNEW